MALHCYFTIKGQLFTIRILYTQVLTDRRIMLTHLLQIVTFLRNTQGVIKEDDRIQTQRTYLTVAREERIAPAQRHRVFQIDIGVTAEDSQEDHDHHQHTAKNARAQ